MQAVWDYVVAHWSIFAIVIYELWSLLPESWVKSSSILTLLGGFIKKPAQLP